MTQGPTLHRAICMLAIACAIHWAGSARADDVVELVIWNLPMNAGSVRDRARLNKVKAFQAKYPNYRVRGSSVLSIAGEAGGGTVFMAIAAGRGPDVYWLSPEAIRNYRDQQLIQPLDELIAAHARETGRPYRGIDTPWRLWQAASDSGHIWAVPSMYKTIGLIYRRDLFQQAGLDPNRPPQDWDEFYEYAKQLTDPPSPDEDDGKIKQYGFALAPGADMFPPWIFAAGGEMARPGKVCPRCGTFNQIKLPVADFAAYHIHVKDPEQLAQRLAEQAETEHRCGQCDHDLVHVSEIQWRLVLDEPAGVAAFEFYRKLRWEKWQRGGKEYEGVVIVESENTMHLAAGKVAMMPFYSYGSLNAAVWQMGMSPAQIGFGPIPGAPGKAPAAVFDAKFWAVSSRVKDPRVRKAAWDYISFMTTDEALEIETRTYVEGGWAVLAEPRYLRRFGLDEYLRDMPKQWVEGYEALERNARVLPYSPGMEKVVTHELNVPIQKLLLDPSLDIVAELNRSTDRANTLILAVRPPEQMAKYRRLARVILGCVVGFALLVSTILIRRSGRARPAPIAPLPGERRGRVHLMAWCFLLPAVLLIILWQYGPLAAGSLMAFYDYRLAGGSEFVGLDNFIEVFAQPMFYRAILNTLWYVLLTLLIGFLSPIVLALLLHEVPRGKVLFRTIFYLPAVTTGLVIMFLWKNLLYEPTSEGILNRALEFFGLPAQTWLDDPNLAMLCIVIPGAWAGAGAGSLIYLAALKNVAEELYEAAEVDGIGIPGKLWHICLPTVRPLIIINLVGATIGAFHAMQNVFVMTGGGPVNSTRTVGLEIWFNAFLFMKFGYATAMAWTIGTFLIMFTLWQLRVLRTARFKAGGA